MLEECEDVVSVRCRVLPWPVPGRGVLYTLWDALCGERLVGVLRVDGGGGMRSESLLFLRASGTGDEL